MKVSLPLLAILPAALSLVSCNGIFGDIYDTVDTIEEATAHDGFTRVAGDANRYLLTIDASSFDKWNYVSLNNMIVESRAIPQACEGPWDGRSAIVYHQVSGDEFSPYDTIPVEPQSEPQVWDFAIHRFDVKTAEGEVAATPFASLDDLPADYDISSLTFTPDVWSDTDVMVDLTDMMAYRIGYQSSMVNRVLSGWVKMDISTPPPTFTASNKVYLMRLADGSVAALKMKSYIGPTGTKGQLTIELIYPWR